MFDHIESRQQAYEMLKGMKVTELKEIAKVNHIYVKQPNKANLIERIVEGTVGAKLRSEAIRTLELN